MTLPKNLQEKRDDEKTAYELCTGPVGYSIGFDAACALLLPEINKLEELLRRSKVGFYSISFVASSNDLKMDMDNLSVICKWQEEKIDQDLKSWREFLGEESEGE